VFIIFLRIHWHCGYGGLKEDSKLDNTYFKLNQHYVVDNIVGFIEAGTIAIQDIIIDPGLDIQLNPEKIQGGSLQPCLSLIFLKLFY
jgi:hypothetical protein